MYKRGTLQPSQVGELPFIIPSAQRENGIIICINLVLPMGWGDPPKFFCEFSETLTDFANTLVDTELPVTSYGAITKTPTTGLHTPQTNKRLTHTDCYMYYVISVVQVGTDCQNRIFDGTVRALKWLFLSLLGESKHSVIVKNCWMGRASGTVSRRSWDGL